MGRCSHRAVFTGKVAVVAPAATVTLPLAGKRPLWVVAREADDGAH